jgi:hypothetical protein
VIASAVSLSIRNREEKIQRKAPNAGVDKLEKHMLKWDAFHRSKSQMADGKKSNAMAHGN